MTYLCTFNILLIAVVVGLTLVRGRWLGQRYGQGNSAVLTSPGVAMLVWRTDSGQDLTSAIYKNLADLGVVDVVTGITGIKGNLHIASPSLQNVAKGWIAASRGPARRRVFMRLRSRWGWS